MCFAELADRFSEPEDGSRLAYIIGAAILFGRDAFIGPARI